MPVFVSFLWSYSYHLQWMPAWTVVDFPGPIRTMGDIVRLEAAAARAYGLTPAAVFAIQSWRRLD